MIKALPLIILVTLMMLQFVPALNEPNPTQPTTTSDILDGRRSGMQAVYRRIETSVDCGYLQRVFNQNEALTELYTGRRAEEYLSYMKVANDRMELLGC